MARIRQYSPPALVILDIGNGAARPRMEQTTPAQPGGGALASLAVAAVATASPETMDSISDTEIALPASSQSNQDLERFFVAYGENAYYVAYAALWNHETAMDVVQESMLKLVEYYRNKSVDDWPALFRTILNSRINDVRRRRLIEQGRHKLVSFTGLFRKDRDDRNSMEEPELPANTRDDSITEPEAGMVAAQLRERVAQALHSLSERQRQVFVLREWRGMTTQETAVTLGCSENSVKQHHFRALRELRKLLAEVWDHA
jgi:RNA polymerase sigma-70 factor (ECF subfamily)